MNRIRTSCFAAPDGIPLAIHERGEGRPLLLLHGFFSESDTNWIKYGHATLLANAGYRVIMQDLRAHGQSGKPHDPASYPKDVLADDALAMIAHLGLKDYDLGGYSLGARTVARMLVRGARPARAIVAGMGFEGLTNTGHRTDHFRHILDHIGEHPRGSPEWMAEAFLKTTGGDPTALRQIIETFMDTSEDQLRGFELPIGVICGAEDEDNGSAAKLASILPQGELITVPGNHMSAVVKPDLGTAMLEFLTRT
jgi:pimeloyl-ACP methyl ester carboxylesterase